MQNFIVTKELLEKVLNYLATKPYIEVAAFIQELSQCKPIQDTSNEPSTTEPN